jgi:hypothetical protein
LSKHGLAGHASPSNHEEPVAVEILDVLRPPILTLVDEVLLEEKARGGMGFVEVERSGDKRVLASDLKAPPPL